MIVVDTNVVSEPLKPQPSEAVLNWLARQAGESLYLTTTSLAELLGGVEKLPEGQRKRMLRESLQPLLTKWFGPRILPFDEAAAGAYAKLVSRARASGHAISVAGGQIAAVAKSRDFAVATRILAHFLQLVCPSSTHGKSKASSNSLEG